jgi:surfeit locus 1 family protein
VRQRHRGWVLLATVLAVLLTARLGWWQLDRAAQKNALQTAMATQQALPPLGLVDLPRPLAALAAAPLTASAAAPPAAPVAPAWQHRAVVLQGQWLDQHTVYLDNRQMNTRVGFFVVTPLLLGDGTAVLVQRGWLPRDLVDRTRLLPVPTPPGPVQVLGRLAPGVPRLYELGEAGTGLIRQNLDVAAFARETGLALRPLAVLQEEVPAGAGGSLQADGLQRQWPAPALGVHKHHGYAFQWFALCALCAGLYAWLVHIRPRWRGRRATARV